MARTVLPDQHADGEDEAMRQLPLYLVFCLLGTTSVFGAALSVGQYDPWRKSPSEAATINEFITTCEGDPFMCEYTMRNAALNNINKKNAQSICITDQQPRQPVISWLKAHSETHDMPTEDGLWTAYTNLYRCP